MTGGNLLLTVVIIIALTAVFSPFLFGALHESGRLRMPRKKSKTFRQFPTLPDLDDGEE